MAKPADVQTVAREVTEESGLTRTQIAEDANLSRATMIAWLAGTRTPQPESVAQLADGLERRAKHLHLLISRLRKAVHTPTSA
ncbi:MAG TPA: helix-turn-helix transcriptional regulator [Longimicrobium sp.]|uniref:helix-turn-helix domain-containing protein n=1 Tax=Longimicrobium sp. TaxID=2029185 RepID=UPI002EDA6A30